MKVITPRDSCASCEINLLGAVVAAIAAIAAIEWIILVMI